MTELTQLQTKGKSTIDVVTMELPSLQSISLMSATNNSSLPVSFRIDLKDQLPTQEQQQQQQQQQEQQQEQKYALKWNDFQASILKSFQHLRDEEDFVDVTISCDQKSFFAHKVVLSACSPYFRKLLKENPCKHPIIILRDVYTDDMERLLSFMYYGEVNVSHTHLLEFLKTAQMLQIRGLTDITNSWITSGINTSEVKSSSTSTINKDSSDILPASDSTSRMNATHNTPGSVSTLLIKSMEIASCDSNNSNSANNSGSANISCNTPAIQELKASSAPPIRKYNNKTNQQWDLTDSDGLSHHTTPPPQKRIKSADLFRAQHGISPDRLLIDLDFPVAGQHPLTRERKDRNREGFRDRDRNIEFRESLLNHALESNIGMEVQKQVETEPLHTKSDADDYNSSDSEASDHGKVHHDITTDSINGSLDNSRSHCFPNAFLGIQGLLAVPSNIGGNDFVSRRSLEMRVRATDPRPCPKCGKIYRSAHTLRTHLEDKHTLCPGYRCVLCGTVAKSRNSLHSHMSRQHRGISTKDLPVLPMPSAFDPELASRLLAKAGVTISVAELRARASPTNSNGVAAVVENQPKTDLEGSLGKTNLELEGLDDDPEDLTTGSSCFGIGGNGNELSRYTENMLNFGQAKTTISRIQNDTAVIAATLGQQKELTNDQLQINSSTGQPRLDLQFLQFITESTFGMSKEHAAAAALHAAKIAQLNVMGQGLEKLSTRLLQPQFDLVKIANVGAPPINNGDTENFINESKSGIDHNRSPTPNNNDLSLLAATSVRSCADHNTLNAINLVGQHSVPDSVKREVNDNTYKKIQSNCSEPDEIDFGKDKPHKNQEGICYTQK